MSRIPSIRVKKIPNSDSITLTHVHTHEITLRHGNQVFHIIQYSCQLFYPPPKFLNAPLPITSQVYSTPPCTPPSPPIEVPLSDQLFEMTSVTYYKTLYIDGAPKNNICIKTTKIQQSFHQLFNALLL